MQPRNVDEALKSKVWRLTHLYKIKDKEGILRVFDPNDIQWAYLEERANHRYNRILKARQLGMTTLTAIDMLDDALFTPGFSGAIIAHEREAVNKIFEIVKRAYENLPAWLKPVTNTDTKQAYRFVQDYKGRQLDSEIYVAMKLRSTTVQWLHISEAAYIKDKQELEAGTKQAVPKSGRISEETTGNGFDEFFDSYTQAKRDFTGDPMQYKTYFYAWHELEEYALPGTIEERTAEENHLDRLVLAEYGYHLSDEQLLWRRWKMRDLTQKSNKLGLSPSQLFKQEYPSVTLEAFQSGAGSVFDPNKLEQIITSDGKTSPALPGVHIWVEPEAGHDYLVACDPSDGGQDYGVIDVWDADTLEQCAQFHGKLRPDELAEKIAEIARAYNNAFTGVENNMLSTVLFLSKIYDNLFYTEIVGERFNKPTKKLGYTTSTKTRDLMIDDYLIAFDEGSLVIHSPITVDEMRTFVRKDNGKREHADGKHDDALFAAMIMLQIRKYGASGRSRILERMKTEAQIVRGENNQNA